MANPIQRLVSKKKRRYQLSGFDLDLTFITDHIIAMGFPAEKIEGLYRNHIDDVALFLESRFPMRYMVFNLCSERDYPVIKFQNRVKKIPFDDHNPPKFTQIVSFCEAAKEWLNQCPEHVIAVHCKAGKGRTGVMICCYILHEGIGVDNAMEALLYYDEKRTSNKKGVTIPSQRRYVHYYGHYLHLRRTSKNLIYSKLELFLTAIHLEGVPSSTGIGGCSTVYFTVHEHSSKLLTSNIYDLRRAGLEVVLDLDNPAPVQGDVKVEFFSKTPLGKEKLFHCWFNTFFVVHYPPKPGDNDPPAAGDTRSCLLEDDCPGISNGGGSSGPEERVLTEPAKGSHHHHLSLTFQQAELDKANKDTTNNKFPVGFKVTLHFVCKGCDQCARPEPNSNWPLLNGNSDSRAQLAARFPGCRLFSGVSPVDDHTGPVPPWEPHDPPAPGPCVAPSSSRHRRFESPSSPVTSPVKTAATSPHVSGKLQMNAHCEQSSSNLLAPLANVSGHDTADSDVTDEHLSETDPEDDEPWTLQ